MTDASLLYVVLLGVYTGHQSGMVTMLLLLLLFVESIHEMTHTRERFNFFFFLFLQTFSWDAQDRR